MAKKNKSSKKIKASKNIEAQKSIESQNQVETRKNLDSSQQNINSTSKMNLPKVSIIIPMYNVEKFITTCVDSILEQTLQDFELILIDDCSTDRTLEIASQKYSNDPRISILKNPKRLRCDMTRTLGITQARGEYIYFMDADDAILPSLLETFVNAAEESQAEVVLMNDVYTTEDEFFQLPAKIKIKKRPFNDPTPRFYSDNIAERIQHEFLDYSSHWEPWTKIQRRDFLINNGISYPDTQRAGDMLFQLAEICYAKKIQVIDACLYVWRRHPNQTVKLNGDELLRLSIPSLPQSVRYIRNIFSSKNLLSTLPEEERANLELKSMRFFAFKTPQIGKIAKLDVMQIESIINEAVIKSETCTPEFMTLLLKIFFAQMISEQDYLNQIRKLKSATQKQSTQKSSSQSIQQSSVQQQTAQRKSSVSTQTNQSQSNSKNIVNSKSLPQGARLF